MIMMDHLDNLVLRYPILKPCKEEIANVFECIRESFASGGKLLVAGNGGSAADADHITGELMKSFLRRRSMRDDARDRLVELYGAEGDRLGGLLEGALPAIPITTLTSLTTAFANDVDPLVGFAQVVYGLGRPGDVFLGISTSGNARNIINAAMVAKACSIKTVALTGRSGGRLGKLCDFVIFAPEDATAYIQELHLPIYHALCAMLEDAFFCSDKVRA